MYGQSVHFHLNKEKITEGEDFWLVVDCDKQTQLPVFPEIVGAIKVKTISRPIDKGGNSFIQVYQAAQVGTLSIPSFRVLTDRKEISSPTLSVQVKHKNPSLKNAYQATAFHPEIQVLTSVNQCYIGEQVHVFAYLFVPIEERDNFVLEEREILLFKKKLKLQGFGEEENEISIEKDTTWNGNRGTFKILYDAFVFPNRAGNFEIGAIALPILRKYILPFGTNAKALNEKNSELRREMLQLKPIHLTVKPLPPTNLLHATTVGNYTITADLSDTHPFTGDELTLKVNIEGIGNIQHLPQPIIHAPVSFYGDEPSMRTILRKTPEEIAGSKHYIYDFYPTQAGNFTIGPITLYFFRPDIQQYDSISIPQKQVHVTGESLIPDIACSDREIFYKTAIKKASEATQTPTFFVGVLGVFSFLLTLLLGFSLFAPSKLKLPWRKSNKVR